MDTQAHTHVDILEGDNREKLLLQLHDIGRYRNREPFKIKIQHPALRGSMATEWVEMQVQGVVAEDGSGDSWLIEGYITTADDARHDWVTRILGPSHTYVRGYYNSRDRKGSLVRQ